MQRLGRVHTEIVLHGEHPAQRVVTTETTVEQDVDQPGEVFGDPQIIEEQTGNGRLPGPGNGQEAMVADQGSYPIGRGSQAVGGLIDRTGVGVAGNDVGRERQ